MCLAGRSDDLEAGSLAWLTTAPPLPHRWAGFIPAITASPTRPGAFEPTQALAMKIRQFFNERQEHLILYRVLYRNGHSFESL